MMISRHRLKLKKLSVVILWFFLYTLIPLLVYGDNNIPVSMMIQSDSSYVCNRGLKMLTQENADEAYPALLQRAADKRTNLDFRINIVNKLAELDTDGSLSVLVEIAQITFENDEYTEMSLPSDVSNADSYQTLEATLRKAVEGSFPPYPVMVLSASPRLNLAEVLHTFLSADNPPLIQCAALIDIEKNSIPHISIADAIIALTHSSLSSVRALAFRAIATKFPPEEVKDFITPALSDKSALVRDAIVSAIVVKLPPGLEPELKKMLKSESNPVIYEKLSAAIDGYDNLRLMSTIQDASYILLGLIPVLIICSIPIIIRKRRKAMFNKGMTEMGKANYKKATVILKEVAESNNEYSVPAKIHLIRAYLRSHDLKPATELLGQLNFSKCTIDDLYSLACDLDGKSLKELAVRVYLNIMEIDRSYKDVEERFNDIDVELGGGRDDSKKSTSGTTSMKALAAKLLGQEYSDIKLVGKGGMGAVFQAKNNKNGEISAIKILAPHLADDEGLKTRFYRESVAIANLSHPNICKIKDIRKAELPFIIMEYIDGQDLKTIMKNMDKPFDLESFYNIANQLVDALVFAHSKNIVHRDIKPENLLITTEGIPKIIDFGLVKFKETSSDITATGAMMGTPKYMSPEQIKGEETVAAPSDIFSLGMVFYEMLSLHYPYPDNAVFQRVFMDPTSLRQYNSNVSAQLESIILKCLQKHADDRFESAAELASMLKITQDF